MPPANAEPGARRLDSALYPQLFAPLQVGAQWLRNRIAHVSITTRMSAGRKVTPTLLNYYSSRARGGAALIITEPVSAARLQNLPHKVRVWSDEDRDGLSRWAAVVEGEDCRLLAQIQDAGRGRHERGRNPEANGVSALADDLSWTVPHVLSISDIQRMVADFAESSGRLQRCGFSGVELSAAHGHLFHQFMSPWMNTRDDAYGGDLEGRCRIMRELLQAIRQTCGEAFIIGCKLPGDDGVPGSIGPAEAAVIAQHLAASAKIDYLSFAQGSHSNSLDMHIPDMHGPRAPYTGLTRQLKAVVPTIPVMAVGLITDPAEANGILAAGAAELIGLGRPLVTDPAWGLKASQGREADIRYCVSCNTCWGTITEHRAIACDNNPRVGMADELDWWPSVTEVRKRIVVVGAGIAGLEAAWIASARGHEVTVFSAGSEVGGKTRLLAALPGGESLSSIYDYQMLAAKKARVHFELGVRATLDDIKALSPDEVVLATGASMTWPRCLPKVWQEHGVIMDLRTCMSELLEFTQPQGGTAVLFDMDATEGTYAAAEQLHKLFDRVVIITPRDRIAEDVPLVTRLGILRRFANQGIETIPLAEISGDSRLEDGVLVYRNIYTGKLTQIDAVVLFTYATPRAPDAALQTALEQTGIKLHVIGDAYAPCATIGATSQGHKLGNEL
jgi:dimethylglycine catabolism A